MAQPLSKAQINALEQTAYQELRPQLQSGDLIFCSGSYLFSGLIQRFTKSVWSHVGIIYRDEALDRIYVLESETGIGVRVVPLSKYTHDYHGRRKPYRGQLVVGRLAGGVGPAQAKAAIGHGMDLLTKPYDNWEIIRIAIRILFQVSKGTRDRKYICSELVEECFRKAGVRFARPDNYISPNDIWCDPKVQMGWRIDLAQRPVRPQAGLDSAMPMR